jgi:hypothetical protein
MLGGSRACLDTLDKKILLSLLEIGTIPQFSSP